MEENNNGNPPAGNPDLGGLKIPPVDNPGAGSGSNAAIGSAAQGVIQKRRGRPPGSTNKPSDGKPQQSVPGLSQAQFAELYSPQLWARIATAPADAMAFATGKKYWEASEGEKQALGSSCSIAAACFASTDPRWLAAAAALITLSNFYGLRIATMAAEKKREREAEEKKNKA